MWYRNYFWSNHFVVPSADSNWHSQKGKDFKSFVSANFYEGMSYFRECYANIYISTSLSVNFFHFIPGY